MKQSSKNFRVCAPLWIALRMMEERRNLIKKMEYDISQKGLSKMAGHYRDKGGELQIHVDKMKEILYATQNSLSIRAST